MIVLFVLVGCAALLSTVILFGPRNPNPLAIGIYLSLFGLSALHWFGSVYSTLLDELGMGAILLSFLFIGYWYVKAKATELNRRKSEWILGVFIILSVVHFISRSEKYGQWDAWMIWNAHGKTLSMLQGWSGALVDQLRHPDYPFFLSSLISLGYRFVPEPIWLFPSFFSFVFFLIFIATIVRTIHHWTSGVFFYIVLILLAVDGNFYLHVSSQNADTLMAFVVFLCCMQVYQPTQKSFDGALLGFLAASSVWIKNEGWVFYLTFTVVYGLMIRASWRTALRYLMGSALPLLICLYFKMRFAPANDVVEAGIVSRLPALFDLERHRIVLSFYANTLLGNYPQLILLGMATLLTPRNKTSIGLTVILMGLMLSYYIVYILTPHDLIWHLSTSLNRLFHHIYPAALLIFSVQFADAQGNAIRQRAQLLLRLLKRKSGSVQEVSEEASV